MRNQREARGGEQTSKDERISGTFIDFISLRYRFSTKGWAYKHHRTHTALWAPATLDQVHVYTGHGPQDMTLPSP